MNRTRTRRAQGATRVLRVSCALWVFCALLSPLGAAPARAEPVRVPPEGQCPPYALEPGEPGPADDATPPLFREGEVVDLDAAPRLKDFLPEEVWVRRDTFFFEGMQLEVGPCHRRFPAPQFFDEATAASQAQLDAEGNLLDYAGIGLPFPPDAIDRDDPQAGVKWAWNSRYRYQGAGLRGDFRILLVQNRGRKIERFTGDFYLLNMNALPGRESDDSFWAGGSFRSPPVSRGILWRQLRGVSADQDAHRSDDIFVYMPEERRTRRAPPTAVDGLYMPSYTRGDLPGGGKLHLPDGTQTPSGSLAVIEHTRHGFTGLLTRPNMYAFELVRVQDVIAPINSVQLGFPAVENRSYGPSGLSLASDRWDIRRAVVLRGTRKVKLGQIHSLELYVDALTQQPLYAITRRSNGHLVEVGILMGRFSADDGVTVQWAGAGEDFGAILPVAASFYVAGDGGWLRESFELRFDPPSEKERREAASVIPLRRGR